jgi:hypothetical protein
MSTPKKNTAVLLSRPKDETLEAFKKFYIELAGQMGVEITDEQMKDEARWEQTWKDFWNNKTND